MSLLDDYAGTSGGSSSGGGLLGSYAGSSSSRRKKRKKYAAAAAAVSSGSTLTARPYSPARRLGRSHDEGEGHGILGALGNLVHDVEDTLQGLPAGVLNTGHAVAQDATNPEMWNDIAAILSNPVSGVGEIVGDAAVSRATGKRDTTAEQSAVFRDVIAPMLEDYQYRYGPLVHGDVDTFAQRAYEHPLAPLLDAAALTAGAGGALDRLGATGRAGARLGRYSEWYRKPRILEHRTVSPDGTTSDGVVFERRRSTSVQGKLAQQVIDWAGDTALLKDKPIVGRAGKARRFGVTAEQHRTRMGFIKKAREFDRARNSLSKDERFAFHLAFETASPVKEFENVWNLYHYTEAVEDADGNVVHHAPFASRTLRRYMERLAGKPLNKIEQQVSAGGDPMADSPIRRVLAESPSPNMAEAVRVGREVDAMSGDVLEQAGVLDPAAREARKFLRVRLQEGARFVEAGQHDKAMFDPADESGGRASLLDQYLQQAADEIDAIRRDPEIDEGEAARKIDRIGKAAQAKIEDPSTLSGWAGPDAEEARALRERQIAGLEPTDVHPGYGLPSRFPQIQPALRDPGRVTSALSTPKTAPLRPVRPPKTTRLNRGIAALTKRMLTEPGVLSHDLIRTMGYQLHLDYRAHLKRLAVPLDKRGTAAGLGNPDDWWYFWDREPRTPNGKVPPLERRVLATDPVERDLAGTNRDYSQRQIKELAGETVWPQGSNPFPHEVDLADVEQMTRLGIKRIPRREARAYVDEMTKSQSAMQRILAKPVDLWRAMVLTYRPAWLVNNIVGQFTLYFMQYPTGVGALVRSMQTEKRDTELVSMWKLAVKKRRFKHARIIEENAPHALFGGFSHAEMLHPNALYLGENKLGLWIEDTLNREGRSRGQKTARLPLVVVNRAIRMVRGVGHAMQDANLKIADDIPRRAAFMNEAKKEQSIRDVRAYLKDAGDANTELEHVLARYKELMPDEHAAAMNRIVDRIDANLGNFSDLTPFERQYIRTLVPFYSWFKMITKITARLGVDHPGRLRMMQLMVIAAGSDEENLPGGHMPSWLRAALPLGGVEGNEQDLLSTTAINPFETPVQIGHALANLAPLAHGDAPIGSGQDAPQQFLTPYAGALMAVFGRDPFYQGEYQGYFADRGPLARGVAQFAEVPEVRLAQQAGLIPTPGGEPVSSTLYDANRQYEGVPAWVLNYLGIPVRRVKLDEAQQRARAGQ